MHFNKSWPTSHPFARPVRHEEALRHSDFIRVRRTRRQSRAKQTGVRPKQVISQQVAPLLSQRAPVNARVASELDRKPALPVSPAFGAELRETPVKNFQGFGVIVLRPVDRDLGHAVRWSGPLA